MAVGIHAHACMCRLGERALQWYRLIDMCSLRRSPARMDGDFTKMQARFLSVGDVRCGVCFGEAVWRANDTMYLVVDVCNRM